MWVCGCSLGNSPLVGAPWGTAPRVGMWALLGELSPHVGAPWRTVPRAGMWVLLGVQPPFGQVLHGVRPLVPHSHEPSRQAPPGRRPGCQPLFSRRRARAVGAGAGGCRTWACDPGAVPSLRPEGTKEATSPSRPGEGGGAEQPTEWTPLQPYSPQEPGRAAAPGASPELQPQATSVHTSLGRGSREDRQNQAESRLCGVGEDTLQPPLIRVWEGQGGSVHKDAAAQGPSSHLV